MKFERIIEGKDHLWAVRDMNKPNNELAALFQKWNDAEYLWDFFLENQNDLQEFFHIERISEAVEDTIDDAEQLERLILEIPYTENLDELFIPLSSADMTIRELAREKARNWNRTGHASWLRVYAIRLEKNVFVITGGAIKLTRTMQEPGNTAETSLTANTPYLFMPDDATMTFPNLAGGVVTLQTTTANDGVYGCATTDAAWNFHGTYKGKSWAVASNDYGFAARSGMSAGGEEVEAGQFVRFTTNAFIKPMRCYLSYVGTSAPAPARRMTRSASGDDLPQSITVRLVSRSGETTAIGEIDTKTGKMTFDSEAWYTLDGVRLSGKPSTKGIYINNGKKIVIK